MHGCINEHVARHIDGLDGVYGGYDVGQKNFEERMLLVLSAEGIMCVNYIV